MATAARSVSSFLHTVRLRLLRSHAIRIACVAIAALALTGVITGVTGYWFGTSSKVAVWLIGVSSVAAILLVSAAAILGFVVPRRRFSNDRDVARVIEQRYPALRSSLQTAVEFGRRSSTESEDRFGSNALAQAHIESTATSLRELSVDHIVSVGETQRIVRASAATTVVCVLAALFWQPVRDGWKRMIAPPREAFDGAVLSDLPLVSDLELSLAFPQHTKLGPAKLPSSSGDIRAIVGTKVAIRAKLLVEATSAEIIFEDEQNRQLSIPLRLASNGSASDREVVGEFEVTKAGHYRFAAIEKNKVRRVEATPRMIEAVPDRAPTVQLIAPADVLDVSTLRQVELAYVAEDDFGVRELNLIWQSNSGSRESGKKAITLGAGSEIRQSGKILWDIGELNLGGDVDVRYWLEATDNFHSTAQSRTAEPSASNKLTATAAPKPTADKPPALAVTQLSGNVGKSREFRLHVISQRERHQQVVAKLAGLADQLLLHLSERLVVNSAQNTMKERELLLRFAQEHLEVLADIQAGFDKDPHASDGLRKQLAKLRERIEKQHGAENRVFDAFLREASKAKVPPIGTRFGQTDKGWVSQLEDDVILVTDWLDREQLEAMLDIADEANAHRKRLAELIDQFNKTKDPRLLAEISRELRALNQALAAINRQGKSLPADVVDQFVNRDAMNQKPTQSCLEQVSALFDAGKVTEAGEKLKQCGKELEQSMQSLEQSLQALRGDRFGDEQRKLDEVMNELSDTTADQDDITAEASRIFDEFAAKANDQGRELKRDAKAKVSSLVDKLRKQLDDMPESGLTPFAKEELDIVERRIGDIQRTVNDGDLAEASAMAKQAEQSLQTIAGELEAAMEDDPKSPFAEDTAEALGGTLKARETAAELAEALAKSSPAPKDLLSDENKRALERLRKRQTLNRERANKLNERVKQLGSELPGQASDDIQKRLGSAMEKMQQAAERMKGIEPGAAREAARAATEALEAAKQKARDGARQKQEGAGASEEPVRIPGSEEYKAPSNFREELLEAMKKRAPAGYEDMLKRYYEELSR